MGGGFWERIARSQVLSGGYDAHGAAKWHRMGDEARGKGLENLQKYILKTSYLKNHTTY